MEPLPNVKKNLILPCIYKIMISQLFKTPELYDYTVVTRVESVIHDNDTHVHASG